MTAAMIAAQAAIAAQAIATCWAPVRCDHQFRLGRLLPELDKGTPGQKGHHKRTRGSEDQVAGARLVALLRRLGMPLPAIADIAAKPLGEAGPYRSHAWRTPAISAVRRR